MKHAGAGTNYSFACDECHKGNSHGTGTFQDVFIDKSGIIAGSAATYTTGTRTCSALYCHGNGTSVATGQPPAGSVAWGAATLACNGCHGGPPAYVNGSPKANSHANHNFGCGICHAGTTADGITIANKSLHVNGVYNVTPGTGVTFTYSYVATGGTCSNISCHGGTGAAWGSTLGCNTCHGNPPPPAAGRYTGVDETTSPHVKHAGDRGANYSFDCNECHKGNSHGTGTYQDVFIDKIGIIAGICRHLHRKDQDLLRPVLPRQRYISGNWTTARRQHHMGLNHVGVQWLPRQSASLYKRDFRKPIATPVIISVAAHAMPAQQLMASPLPISPCISMVPTM